MPNSSTLSSILDCKAESSLIHQPRLGLGSTESENIALRRNIREKGLLLRKQKNLTTEQHYTEKLIELSSKSIQVSYKRLTKRVSRIQSHLTEEEIKILENDQQKQAFADKYRKLLHDDDKPAGEGSQSSSVDDGDGNIEINKQKKIHFADENVIPEEAESMTSNSNGPPLVRSNTLIEKKTQKDIPQKARPNTTSTCQNNRYEKPQTDTLNDDIIPSLEELLDQLHNIKPQQFYENQRKLKLYDIQLFEEELDSRKQDLFSAIDAIINWDKKEDEEEKRQREEEERAKNPPKRKTKFMRSILRNFSMELMIKSRQYGWADMGQCRYLRGRGGDGEGGTDGVNTLAKDTMKIKINHDDADDSVQEEAPAPFPPGFDNNGKFIRTADLLNLKE